MLDRECAFCGRADAATHQLFCQDCQSQHRVCTTCADEARPDAAQLGLDPIPQAA